MEIKYIILILIYLAFTIVIQIMILRSVNFSPSHKKIHSILLWLIPIVWGILLITSQRVSSTDLKKPSKRDLHDSEYSDNWKDLTGIGGPGKY
jgi:hypothetical protein